MDAIEFIKLPDVATPIEWDDSNDLVGVLRKRIDAFGQALNELDDGWIDDRKKVTSAVKRGGEKLLEIMALFLNGEIARAYDTFEDGIQSFGDALATWKTTSSDTHTRRMQLLYRMRRTIEPKLSKAELFHIPFEKRHLVASQRFSIPGLPCLYTSGSTYTCWEEMGRPPFHELQVAALWVPEGKSFTFLDLRWTARAIAVNLDYLTFGKNLPTEDKKNSWLKSRISEMLPIWPLIALCTIRVKNRFAAFKPEYIIPQMVLHWIASDDDIDGVAYESTHITYTQPYGLTELANYAFPTREISHSGYCGSLLNKFRMTEPLSWSLLRSLTPDYGVASGSYDIEVHPNLKTPLMRSDFGHVQGCLEEIASRNLHAVAPADDGTIVKPADPQVTQR